VLRSPVGFQDCLFIGKRLGASRLGDELFAIIWGWHYSFREIMKGGRGGGLSVLQRSALCACTETRMVSKTFVQRNRTVERIYPSLRPRSRPEDVRARRFIPGRDLPLYCRCWAAGSGPMVSSLTVNPSGPDIKKRKVTTKTSLHGKKRPLEGPGSTGDILVDH